MTIVNNIFQLDAGAAVKIAEQAWQDAIRFGHLQSQTVVEVSGETRVVYITIDIDNSVATLS